MRRAAVAISALAVALGLTACGGGSEGATTKESAPSAAAPARNGASTKGGGSTGRGSGGSGQAPPSTPGGSKEGGGAGGKSEASQAFVQPGGDNSIPNFGSEASDAERSEATKALERFLAAREQGDWAAVCDALRGKGRQELNLIAKATKGKITGCVAIMRAVQGRVPASARESHLQGEIVSLRLRGREAFALFHGDNGIDYVMPMQHVGSEWKMSQIAPIPYPLGTQEPSE